MFVETIVRRLAAGECFTCSAPVGANKRYCDAHAKLLWQKQKARNKDPNHTPRVYHCGYCGGKGHKITTCKKVDVARL